MTKRLTIAGAMFLSITTAAMAAGQEAVPAFDVLLAHKVALKPELVGVHPRVFVTKSGLETLRERARSTHRVEWTTGDREPRGPEGGAPADTGTAGTTLAEQCGVRDCRSGAGIRSRSQARVSRGREELDARGDRLRTVGLHLQQAEYRPRRRAPALRDRLGLRPPARRSDEQRTSPHPHFVGAARESRL